MVIDDSLQLFRLIWLHEVDWKVLILFMSLFFEFVELGIVLWVLLAENFFGFSWLIDLRHAILTICLMCKVVYERDFCLFVHLYYGCFGKSVVCIYHWCY